MEDLTDLFAGWDEIKPTDKCLHCDGTGKAPGDGRTECGFCTRKEDKPC